MNKKFKISLWIVLILTISILAGSVIIPNVLEPKLRKALSGEFSEQTNEQYSLKLTSLNISLWSRTISVDSIVVLPSTDSLELKKLEASSVSIDGIQWVSLFSQRFPKFRSVTVENPVAELYPRRISSVSTQKETPPSNSEMELSIFDIFIKKGSGKITERDGNTVFSLDSFDMSAKKVNLNTILQGTYVPYLNDLSFSGVGLFWNLEEKFYHFTIDEFAFSKKSKIARVEGLAFTPIVPKYDFSKFKGNQIDRFDLTINSIEVQGFDLDSLMKPSIELSTIIIDKADLEVFHDKHMPPGPNIRYKPLLHQVSKSFGFPIGINSIKVQNSRIMYGEHLPGSEMPGFISFNNLNATLTDFYTSEHPKYELDSLYLDATTKFMDTSTLTLDIGYAVYDEKDTHSLKASFEEMDVKILNPMLVNTAFIEIESGFINRLDLNMTLTRDRAIGKMWLDYENLKVKMLDQNDATNTNFKTRLKSLIANTFVMNKSNTGADFKVSEINFERPKDKAIFGYWWKSIQSGLEETIK